MLKIKEYKNVYPPAEDSILLLKAVKYSRGKVLDMCTGTGIIAINAAKKADSVLAVDINPYAIKAAKANARLNSVKNIKFLLSDLFSKVGKTKFDVIYANPPYLPEKRITEWMDYALDGGGDGSKTTLKIIKGLKNHLKRDGTAFIILSDVYDINKVYKQLKHFKFSFRKLNSISFFFERLFLIKIYYGEGRNSRKRRKIGSSSDYKQISASS